MKSTIKTIALAVAMLAGATAAQAGQLVAKIDVSEQRMTVVKDGKVLYNWKVSTARSGYSTPRGSYKPTRMHTMWYSKKYHNSPMPYSVFFRGGYAIHGTNAVSALGRPASHGCVRLHTDNAAQFYALVKQVGAGNTRITITN